MKLKNVLQKRHFASILFLTLLLASTVSWGQTGVGVESPDPDAQLEIKSTNKGLLIPRLKLTGTTSKSPLTKHVAGMLVYNTATAGSGSSAVRPGFYYNDGTRWIRTDQDATEVAVTDGTIDINGDGTPDNNVTVQQALENIDKVVQANETTSTLTDNSDGTYTYKDEDGTTTTFDITRSGAGDPNGNGTTGQVGDVYVDESTGDLYVYDGTTWTKVGGGSVTSATAAPTSAKEGDVWFDTTNDTTHIYDGTNWLEIKDDQDATEVAVTDGTIDIDGNGTPDNNVTVQQALENLDKLETTSTLTDNSDGTYTYKDEDGTTTTFDITRSGAGDPNGNGTTGQVGDVYVDESTGDLYVYDGTTWNKVGGGSVTSATAAPASAKEGDVWFDTNNDNTHIYDGTNWLEIKDDQDATEVAVTDGTVDIDGNGTPDSNVTVQQALENLDKIVEANETTSTLVNNNDGTYTYKDEDGTPTTFDVTRSGTGDPTGNGTTGQAGDVYVDESTGNLYTHDGTSWSNVSTAGVQTLSVGAKNTSGAADVVPIQLSNSGGTVNIEEGSGIMLTENITTNTVSISVAGGVGAADEPWRTGTNAPATNTSGDIYYDNGDVSIGTTTNRQALRLSGAVYVNVRVHSGTGPIQWRDDDYIVIINGNSQPWPLLLPEGSSTDVGRVLVIMNSGNVAATFADGSADPNGDHPVNPSNTRVFPGFSATNVYDGTGWRSLSGRE